MNLIIVFYFTAQNLTSAPTATRNRSSSVLDLESTSTTTSHSESEGDSTSNSNIEPERAEHADVDEFMKLLKARQVKIQKKISSQYKY